MAAVGHLAAGAQILTERPEHARLLDSLHQGDLVRGHVGLLAPLREEPSVPRGAGDKEQVELPVDEGVGDDPELAHPGGLRDAVDRHLGRLILIPAGHLLAEEVGFLESPAGGRIGKEYFDQTQRGMLPGELVDLHPEPAELRQMTDPGDPLTQSEGPELLEMPLGDPDLLTGHGAPTAIPRREIIASALASDPQFLPPFADDIALLDLNATATRHLGWGRGEEEFSADGP